MSGYTYLVEVPVTEKEMEILLNVKDAIDQKLEEGNKKLSIAQENFAKAHNVNLVKGEANELAEKLEKVHVLNKYYNDLYLIFFKPYIQEQSLVEAISKNNITGMEQSKNTLKKYSEEGLEKLKTIKPFDGDNSVIAACKSLLQRTARASAVARQCQGHRDQLPGICFPGAALLPGGCL